MNLFGCIKDDADKAMQVLNLSMDELRGGHNIMSITRKKAMVSCYLRHECGYTLSEIADYCHKDRSSIVYHVKKYTKDYNLHANKLIQLTQEV
jgi:DNA-binding MarR family transcriptional regulator